MVIPLWHWESEFNTSSGLRWHVTCCPCPRRRKECKATFSIAAKMHQPTFNCSQMDRMRLILWRFCRFCQKWKRSLDFLATSAAASQIHMRMQDAASCQMCVWYFAKHKHNIAGKEHKTSLKPQCTCIDPSHFQGPSHVTHVSWMRKTPKAKKWYPYRASC